MLAITLLAASLRLAAPSRMAVEHFDEGVYASNQLADFQDPPGAYPDRHLYAPPLFPKLLEWSLILGGGQAWAVMAVNVIAGTLMAPLVWCCARDWFGRDVALVAMLLAATSDYHIAFSRMALTDVLLALWLLAAVHAGSRAIVSGGLMWVLAAGAFASLAWWAKYNGWLAIAITGSGATAWWWAQRGSRMPILVVVGRWLATAILAGLAWIWLRSALPPGVDYADISTNHRRYLTGAWWNGLLQHWSAHRYLDGWSTIAGVAIAVGGVAAYRFTWNVLASSSKSLRWTGSAGAALIAVNCCLLLGSSTVLAVLAVGGICGALGLVGGRYGGGTPSPIEIQKRRLAGWMLAAWLTGLSLATPLYYPYPRLSLPWLVATWLGAAVLLKQLSCSARVVTLAQGLTRGIAVTSIAVLAMLVPIAAWCRGAPVWPLRPVAWQDHRGLERIATQILADVTDGNQTDADGVQALIYVYAEPALFFHLETQARRGSLPCLAHPAGNLELVAAGSVNPRHETYVVIGPHGFREGEQVENITRHLDPVQDYEYHPSDLVRLDERPAWSLDDASAEPSVRLFRVP